MNTERILELADLIERQPHTKLEDEAGFNMTHWSHQCGTPACICGWANFQRNESLRTDTWLGRTYVAAEWLGIGPKEALALFEPEDPDADWESDVGNEWWEDITPTHAAAVLRHLAKTGEVNWSIGAPEAA